MKYYKISTAALISLFASTTSYAALTWTGIGADLVAGNTVTGTVTDTVSGGSTGYTLTVNSVSYLSGGAPISNIGINWGSDGSTNASDPNSRSVDGGLHWTNKDQGNITGYTITLTFDTAVDLIWSQASDDGGGENNPFTTTMQLSGYSGLATVNAGTTTGSGAEEQAQIVSVNNASGSVSFAYRTDVGLASVPLANQNNGITNSLADWTITTPTSNTYTITYNTGATGASVSNSIDHEWLAITDGFVAAPVPEPSSAALLGLGGLALILRRRRMN